jgi:hypothetical protein
MIFKAASLMTVVMLYIENNIETTDTGSFADSLNVAEIPSTLLAAKIYNIVVSVQFIM